MMKYFCNHYKDDPYCWSCFNSREELEKYMNNQGGCFIIKVGETFNLEWIKEEIKNRTINILI